MSKSTDKDIEKYVSELMPKKVKKALADAQFDLFHGPGGGGGMGWVKASKIVEDWWSENMRDDLVVDDGGNVTSLYDYEKLADKESKDRYKEALKEGKAEGLDEDEIENFALREAEYYRESFNEVATMVDALHVKRMILGRDWQ
jgi:hypothetical protein